MREKPCMWMCDLSDDGSRILCGDLFDLHSPFRRHDQHRPPGVPIHDDPQIQLAGNFQPLFNVQDVDMFAFRASLNRHQRASQHP